MVCSAIGGTVCMRTVAETLQKNVQIRSLKAESNKRYKSIVPCLRNEENPKRMQKKKQTNMQKPKPIAKMIYLPRNLSPL